MQVLHISAVARRVKNRYYRTLAKRLGCRHYSLLLKEPLISFSFDDFPLSALAIGGTILKHYGVAGTYYACLGLMGSETPTGRIFAAPDLEKLLSCGHELGCHTFDHYDSWDTAPLEFEASILRNQRAISEQLPGTKFRCLSYPISCPRPETKRRVATYYECARGGGQTFNAGTMDLNYLKAFFIEQSRDNFAAIKQTIDGNARAKGWLIFATHDVCDQPTRFGCSPGFFEKVVDYAIQSKATILPVFRAWQVILGTTDEDLPMQAAFDVGSKVDITRFAKGGAAAPARSRRLSE
jgi:peptidoglycan/xylan/chitin deacetylase (PgdA/CDA1 family)